jgi:hypothetical protein
MWGVGASTGCEAGEDTGVAVGSNVWASSSGEDADSETAMASSGCSSPVSDCSAAGVAQAIARVATMSKMVILFIKFLDPLLTQAIERLITGLWRFFA